MYVAGGAWSGSDFRSRRNQGTVTEAGIRDDAEIVVCVHLGQWGDLTDHRLAVCVPRAHHQAIVRLVQPGAQGCELTGPGVGGERG